MTEKSVFREAWSPELTSQSFPVSCFWCRGFVPPPEVKFDAFGTSKHGEGKSLSNFFFFFLSAHWGDLIEQIKKSVIYTLKDPFQPQCLARLCYCFDAGSGTRKRRDVTKGQEIGVDYVKNGRNGP